MKSGCIQPFDFETQSFRIMRSTCNTMVSELLRLKKMAWTNDTKLTGASPRTISPETTTIVRVLQQSKITNWMWSVFEPRTLTLNHRRICNAVVDWLLDIHQNTTKIKTTKDGIQDPSVLSCTLDIVLLFVLLLMEEFRCTLEKAFCLCKSSNQRDLTTDWNCTWAVVLSLTWMKFEVSNFFPPSMRSYDILMEG